MPKVHLYSTFISSLRHNRNPLDLVKRLDVGGAVWKGTDGAVVSYHCGKLIFGQTILLSELSVTVDAQVEVPGHGTERPGVISAIANSACAASSHRRWQIVASIYSLPSG
jgi:hypothetical protein